MESLWRKFGFGQIFNKAEKITPFTEIDFGVDRDVFDKIQSISEIAIGQIGVKETIGSEHNPEVLKYFSETGHEWVKDDETAWCSAFVNWVCMKANRPVSGKLTARSWLKIGKRVDVPKVGDIVVLWRESPTSWKGHVGIFCREQGHYIYILGGNQKNSVCVQAYQKRQLLEYRRL